MDTAEPQRQSSSRTAAEARQLFGDFDAFALYIDQLANGEPVRLHRWELPDHHPERAFGSLQDDLILGADDLLRPA